VIVGALVFPNIEAVGEQVVEGTQPHNKEILDATVQINIYALSEEARSGQGNMSADQVRSAIGNGAGYYLAEGLGTVVNVNGLSVIVTHYHWGEFLMNADLVELLDANGNKLADLSLMEFKALALFIDNGTLILNIPAGVNLQPIELLENTEVVQGMRLLVARRNRENGKTVELIEADVEGAENYKSQACWRLKTLGDEPIIPGDSGGGVFLKGKLVGNNLARVLEYDQWYWAKEALDQEAGEQVVVVAQFPEDVPALVTENTQVDGEASTDGGSRHERIEQ
jgi:hypothetical protein